MIDLIIADTSAKHSAGVSINIILGILPYPNHRLTMFSFMQLFSTHIRLIKHVLLGDCNYIA